MFGEGDELYDAMLTDIRQATDQIRLASYIFAGDEIGLRFADSLAERARAGILVQIHLDAAGSWFEGTDRLLRRLRQAGVGIRWFNRWRWRNPWLFNYRNHRKLLIIDDICVYVGGFNIHKQSSRFYTGPHRWRDVHVRMTGSLVRQASELFDDLWMDRQTATLPPWQGKNRLVPNTTRVCRRVLHCLYLDALSSAQRRIDIASPYFVPDRRLRAALVAAARRGVVVRILIPRQSDQKWVQFAVHALARKLMGKGVRFYEYLPRMMHAKVSLIDTEWAMIGSANIDYRSFFTNQEMNLISQDPVVCQQLAVRINSDFEESQPLNRDVVRLPLLSSLAERLMHKMRRWL